MAGVENHEQVSISIEGISLFSDMAKHLPIKYIKAIFPNYVSQMISYLRDGKEQFLLVRDIFAALYDYCHATNDYDVASNNELLQISIEQLEALKKDGSEEALGAYDNICSFLVVSGKITGQPPEYWVSLSDYCLHMESDEIEVGHVVFFFVEEMSNGNDAFKLIKATILNLIVCMFYGRYYSFLKNDKDNEGVITKLRELLMREKEIVQVAVDGGSEFVKKNFANFWQ